MAFADRPEVSVIMATQARNQDYLKQALRSILAQTLCEIEVLIIFDGCSREKATAALSEFSDPRLRPVVSEKLRGLARCLNIAARLARAPILARMDDDDRCLPARLERQLTVMREGPIDVLGTQAWVIDAQGDRVSGLVFRGNPTTPFSAMRAVFGNIFVHPSVMMRRDWLLRHRYDAQWSRGQDRELWVRAAPTSRYFCIDEPLLEYRRVTSIKPIQVKNIEYAYRLIWKNRNSFGFWTPLLIIVNTLRYIRYKFLLLRLWDNI